MVAGAPCDPDALRNWVMRTYASAQVERPPGENYMLAFVVFLIQRGDGIPLLSGLLDEHARLTASTVTPPTWEEVRPRLLALQR